MYYDRKSAAEFLNISISLLSFHVKQGNLTYISKSGDAGSGGRLFDLKTLERFKEAREKSNLAQLRENQKSGHLTVKSAAKILGVTTAAVYKWIKENKIFPVYRKPYALFTKDEVFRVLAEQSERNKGTDAI